MLFKINGTEYNVGVTTMQRSVKKTYKYDVTTQDGVRHTEVKAIYPVYTLSLGSINQSAYDSLRNALNTYDDTVSVTVPDGQNNITFDANVELGSDGIMLIEGETIRWDGITVTFTAVNPIEQED